MPEASPATTIIAFDIGLRRIGIAVGQTVTGSASPLGIVVNSDAGPDFERISTLLKEWKPDMLILGLPLHANGSNGEMSQHVRAFAKDLERFQLPIELVDERHSSQEAEAKLKAARQSGSRGRIKKEHVDSAAAVLIAERFLAGDV